MSVELNKENTGQRDQVEGLLTLYDLCMHSAHGAQLVTMEWLFYSSPPVNILRGSSQKNS